MVFSQSAGMMYTVAGQNSHDEVDPNLSLFYDWGDASTVTMSNPRPGTPAWRKQSRHGLAGMLATVSYGLCDGFRIVETPMAESNCSGPTRATLFGATEHNTQSTTQNFQIPLKGIKLVLDYCGASVSVVSMDPLNNSSRIIDQSSKKVAARIWPNRLPHGLERCHKILKLLDRISIDCIIDQRPSEQS
jgi:hypothetical protein